MATCLPREHPSAEVSMTFYRWFAPKEGVVLLKPTWLVSVVLGKIFQAQFSYAEFWKVSPSFPFDSCKIMGRCRKTRHKTNTDKSCKTCSSKADKQKTKKTQYSKGTALQPCTAFVLDCLEYILFKLWYFVCLGFCLQKPTSNLHNQFSTGHANSPCTIVIGRAQIEKVSVPARPYKMLNNLMLNRKMDFNEDLSGKCSLNACSHKLLGHSVCDFLGVCYLHPTPYSHFRTPAGSSLAVSVTTDQAIEPAFWCHNVQRWNWLKVENRSLTIWGICVLQESGIEISSVYPLVSRVCTENGKVLCGVGAKGSSTNFGGVALMADPGNQLV